MVDLELIEAVSVRLNIVFLTSALLFSTVATLGFRGTPWGRVVRPLPLVAVGFLAGMVGSSLPIPVETETVVVAASWAIAIAAIWWSAFEYWRLESGRVVAG